ncbi:MAG: LON peptidase substrate-binding domain-containing protein [Rhodobacterales bacterium]|nr:LON peptidase substrate-binding domain-containing protein [Rhodobacterales bacterium]
MNMKTDLPESLPIFPLSGAVLLPRARLPLNIFEPRYLTMLEDVLKTPHRMIGMVQPNGMTENTPEELHLVGCAGRVTQFTETDDGRYILTLKGVSRFKVNEEFKGFTPYRRCKVDWNGFDRDLGGAEDDPRFDRPAFLELLSRYFDAKKLTVEWESLREADDEMLINSLSMLLELQGGEKQALLEAGELGIRREILETLMEYSLRGGIGEEMMQ